jgi:pimeloyl-ACP methyl ester carboxylesterase
MLEKHVEGHGPLVVLVPSIGRGQDDLAEIAAGLAAHGRRVVRPEPRGCGGSTGPLTNLSYVDWAADLASVVDDPPAVLVGHAAGSRYARACAQLFPDLVCGLVVAAAAAQQRPAHLDDDLRLAADETRPVEERRAALRRSFLAPGGDPGPWLTGWCEPTLAAQRATTPTGDWHRAGTVPILDLIGADDAWRPPHTRNELRDRLGDRVSVSIVAGAGHAMMTEQPAAVVTAIAEWLRSLA